LGNPDDVRQLTRSPRPQGEGIVTDNPQNVTAAAEWRPAAYRAQAPRSGVRLHGGIFLTAMENNIRYLLDSFSVDDLLRQFRERGGQTGPFFDSKSRSILGGRFGRLKRRPLPDGGGQYPPLDRGRRIAPANERCGRRIAGLPGGGRLHYGFPQRHLLRFGPRGYTRAWTTLGLIAAGDAGQTKAFTLLRGYYDWFNRQSYLREMLRGGDFGGCGMVANTQLYFTPVGLPADMQVLQRYFQENTWMEDLGARKAEAVWQYPYDRPHCYLLMQLEAYLDLYRSTGDRRYLDAVLAPGIFFAPIGNIRGKLLHHRVSRQSAQGLPAARSPGRKTAEAPSGSC